MAAWEFNRTNRLGPVFKDSLEILAKISNFISLFGSYIILIRFRLLALRLITIFIWRFTHSLCFMAFHVACITDCMYLLLLTQDYFLTIAVKDCVCVSLSIVFYVLCSLSQQVRVCKFSFWSVLIAISYSTQEFQRIPAHIHYPR